LWVTLACANSNTKTKCTKHVISTDVYEILSCITGAKSNDVKAFYEYIKRVTGYSRDYVTYFLRIANLCRVYPRLLYDTVSSDKDFRSIAWIYYTLLAFFCFI